MNNLLEDIAKVAAIGVGATATMDLWLLLLQRLGVPSLNFAMIGRWVGHWRRGDSLRRGGQLQRQRFCGARLRGGCRRSNGDLRGRRGIDAWSRIQQRHQGQR